MAKHQEQIALFALPGISEGHVNEGKDSWVSFSDEGSSQPEPEEQSIKPDIHFDFGASLDSSNKILCYGTWGETKPRHGCSLALCIFLMFQ